VTISGLRAVTFDAAGTLIGVRDPVGATYARLARAHGVELSASALGEAFRAALAAAPPLEGNGPGHEVERAWWRSVVRSTVERAGWAPGADAAAFDAIFAGVFEHYARPDTWQALPDVDAVLGALRRRGVKLGIISNFDSRLGPILAGLGLEGSFDAVVLSVDAGAAKPKRAIFARALDALGGLEPGHCAHVGDSLADDAIAAAHAGLHSFWLDRPTHEGPGGEPVAGHAAAGSSRSPTAPLPAGVVRLESLAELLDYIAG
jgi:putative hydrolase of the HAD superfamily